MSKKISLNSLIKTIVFESKQTNIILEFSEVLVNKMYEHYKKQNTTDSEEVIKKVIQALDTLKTSIDKKLKDPNSLVSIMMPETLKNGGWKDITKWENYEDLKSVIINAYKKDIDPYKMMLNHYIKDPHNASIEPEAIKNYVDRFKEIQTQLVSDVKAKNNDVINAIPKSILDNKSYADLTSYKDFNDLETLIDSAYPMKSTADLTKYQNVEDDIVYDKNGIEIFKGDSQNKCIRYALRPKDIQKGPRIEKETAYGFCISVPLNTQGTSNLYKSYRFGKSYGLNRMFYFVVDKTQIPIKKSYQKYENKWHLVVIHATENGKYVVSNANNDPEKSPVSWEELGNVYADKEWKQLWERIKGLKDIFKFVESSKEEKKQHGFTGMKLSVQQFAQLDASDKEDWLIANINNKYIITDEILKVLDGPQVLRLIQLNKTFSYQELKRYDDPKLLTAYAKQRMIHAEQDQTSPTPMPFIFIPYLPSEWKKTYWEKYPEYHRFDILKEYGDPEDIKKYISENLKQLAYLPQEAITYMDDKQKRLYELYSPALMGIKVTTEGDIDEETSSQAKKQIALLVPISAEDINKLDPNKWIQTVSLYKKLKAKNNINKFDNFIMGMPVGFTLNDKLYFITPKDSNNINKLVIIDETGNIMLDNINAFNFIKNDKEIERNRIINKYVGSTTIYPQDKDYDNIMLYIGNDKKTYDKNQLYQLINQKAEINEYLFNKWQYMAGITK